MDPILKLKNISKSFYGVKALENVDFKINKGEVRAVVGANGAGKSTLMKIIGGVHKPSTGKIYFKNEEIRLNSPLEAKNYGISTIYQELSVIPTLDILANVFLNREHTKNMCFLDEGKMLEEYDEIADKLKFNIHPKIKLSKLSIAHQQMIEIMKTLANEAEIIIMDEPTTSLTESEKEKLFSIISELKNSGKTIIYISHILEEIFKIADSITVLKDGNLVGTYPEQDLNKEKLVNLMIGKQEKNNYSEVRDNKKSDKSNVLVVKNLSNKFIDNISFSLKAGEIIGLAGLVGSGRTELCNAIFGVDNVRSGNIYLEDEEIYIDSPEKAIKNGIGLIPEDRKNFGLILDHPIYKNSTIIKIKQILNKFILDKKKEIDLTNEAVDSLNIKLNNLKEPVKSLSGGNQQKVVVSKWLDLSLKVLIFDEPTKGIDVNAKEDIFNIISKFANEDVGIIFVSSDLEEVIRVADKIIVMNKGKIVEELINENVDQQKILNLVLSID